VDDLELRDESLGPTHQEHGEPAERISARDPHVRSTLEFQQRLEDITRLVSDWIWETDRDFKFTYVSDRIFERLQYHPAELIGRPLLDFISLHSPDAIAPDLKRPFRDRLFTIKSKTGENRQFLLSAVPIYHPETENFAGLRGTAEDITTRLTAEQALVDSESRYRTLVDLSPVAIFVIKERKIVFANSSATRLFGAESAIDLMGRDSLSLSHEDSRELLKLPRRQLLKSGESHPVEIRHIRLDGTEFYATDSSSLITWQGEEATMLVINDISDIKEAQRAVEESERRFQDFEEAAADRFWETDAEHRFTYMSAAGGKPGIVAADERLGKRRWDIAGPQDNDDVWKNHIADLDARRPFRDFRFKLTAADGTEHYMRSNGIPKFDEDGKFLGYHGTSIEETAEVLARDQAEKTQSLFFSSIENFSEGFALWDANDRFVYCNGYFRDEHLEVIDELQEGRQYADFIRVLAEVRDFADEDERDVWIESRLQDTEESESMIESLRGGRWAQIRKHRLQNGNTIIIYADVTEQKLREQAIRESEDRLRLITDQVPAFIGYNDRDLNFTFANHYFETVGLRRDDVVGKNFVDIFGQETLDRVQGYIDRAFAGEQVNYDNVLPMPDGSEVMTNVSLTPDVGENGDVVGIFILSMDITERKLAESRVEASNQGLDTAQRIAKLGSWQRDLVTGEMRWSDEHYRLLGLDPAGPAIEYDQFISLIHEDDRPWVRKIVQKTIDDQQKSFSVEYRLTLAEGVVKYVRAQGEISYGDDGKALAVLGTTQDVTEQHLAQEALELAKRDAEFANRAKSEFLSSMIHELRTPLNAVLGYAQLLLQNRKEQLSERQQRQVGQILNSGRHLLQLINDILDLSRVESGQFSVSPEDVDPKETIQESIALIATQAERNKVTIINDTEQRDLPKIRADRMRLKQALLNFLSNSVKYNVRGGRVIVSCTKQDDAMLRFTVEDTGRGISEENQARLFEPFTRLGADNDGIEGTGIGLTITKQMVEAMGGRIGYSSQLGMGSIFWFELPIMTPAGYFSTPAATASADSSLSSTTGRGNRVILYVEDDTSNLELMSEVINHFPGLSLVSATTGEEGIDLARTIMPDVIFMDINLPGIDGYETNIRLKKEPRTAEIPVIALSAAAMPHDIAKGIDAGFRTYLTKPFNIEEIMNAIDSALKDPSSREA